MSTDRELVHRLEHRLLIERIAMGDLQLAIAAGDLGRATAIAERSRQRMADDCNALRDVRVKAMKRRAA